MSTKSQALNELAWQFFVFEGWVLRTCPVFVVSEGASAVAQTERNKWVLIIY